MEKHDVIQITDEKDKWYGSILIIDEVKSWGVQAYVVVPLQGLAYYRIENEKFEVIGKAKIIPE